MNLAAISPYRSVNAWMTDSCMVEEERFSVVMVKRIMTGGAADIRLLVPNPHRVKFVAKLRPLYFFLCCKPSRRTCFGMDFWIER